MSTTTIPGSSLTVTQRPAPPAKVFVCWRKHRSSGYPIELRWIDPDGTPRFDRIVACPTCYTDFLRASFDTKEEKTTP